MSNFTQFPMVKHQFSLKVKWFQNVMARRTNLRFDLYFEKVNMIKPMSYVLPHQSKAIATIS